MVCESLGMCRMHDSHIHPLCHTSKLTEYFSNHINLAHLVHLCVDVIPYQIFQFVLTWDQV